MNDLEDLHRQMDNMRAELEGVHARLAAAEEECDQRRQEATEHHRLFELQHRRTQAAERLWREAHPGNDDVYPDLGELIGWMLGEMGKPTVAQDQTLSEGELARVRESLAKLGPAVPSAEEQRQLEIEMSDATLDTLEESVRRLSADLAEARAQAGDWAERASLAAAKERDRLRDERQKLVDDVDEARRVAIGAAAQRDEAANLLWHAKNALEMATKDNDRLRGVLADTPDPTLLSKLRGIITDALDEPGSWDNVVHAILAALRARAGEP